MANQDNFSIHCQNCSFSHLCLPVALNKTEIESLDDIIERKKPLHKHDKLVRPGDAFRSLYAVRSGSLKSFVNNQDGEEQIVGFHFPGDIIGFDALRESQHQSFTQALETAMVCELPYETLDKMAIQFHKLRHQLMSFMSAEIKQHHDMMMLLNKRTAEERLLYFLAHLSKRFEERGFSHRQFNLSMTRNEIGNYLGLTVETISRLLTRFQKEGIIEVEGKLISIMNFAALDNKLQSMTISSHCG
ncbi:fumarate/nitrate reduction transcriptional regulator Fnr [Alteromonas pelagimontana]|uniref:Fumarate/nitrate reduction transcriptional regulator Fnr n=1 Tax=Alteromonas pelagimontana TaxID=1858656 RepID=A0A6M4M9J9_9ALTE|nr:fumarate/nitrate reduction transcriptional regulator Fnr [Alteromonas pelagimontana]QJR79305.1 fumarate/nitrate reduction transcriptional regulator Fnr [Alteromonas pelagimontana]QJR82663.1 fumarate/nitrate reduction transcriptional regulator Fnr [Alteromonas pelagimontana]